MKKPEEILKVLKNTNQFSTGDISVMKEMATKKQIGSLKLWIMAKSIPLVESKLIAIKLQGYDLQEIAKNLIPQLT